MDSLHPLFFVAALLVTSCFAGNALGNYLCRLAERKSKARVQRSYADVQRSYADAQRSYADAQRAYAERAK